MVGEVTAAAVAVVKASQMLERLAKWESGRAEASAMTLHTLDRLDIELNTAWEALQGLLTRLSPGLDIDRLLQAGQDSLPEVSQEAKI